MLLLHLLRLQLSCAKTLGKSSRELAVIHVSLAMTYTDLRQHHRAIEHYRQELALRLGNPSEVSLSRYYSLFFLLNKMHTNMYTYNMYIFMNCLCCPSVSLLAFDQCSGPYIC